MCSVSVGIEEKNARVIVIDNGRGFDPSIARGMGLRSITTRARTVNGDAEVRSAPGHGTTITVRLPIEATT